MTRPFDTASASQDKPRGFHHLADRLALTDDSLNSCMITRLGAGLIRCDYTQPDYYVNAAFI